MPLSTDADTIATVIDTVAAVVDTIPATTTAAGDSFHIYWPTVIDVGTKISVAVSALATAYYARKGVTSWIGKKVSTEEHDLAVEILTEIYEMRAYMDGALNSSLMWAQQATMLNQATLDTYPDYHLPWQRPFECSEWVTDRSNLVNRLVCKSKALEDNPTNRPDLNDLLAQTTIIFGGYMGELHGRIKAQFDPSSARDTVPDIDPQVIQEGQSGMHIQIGLLVSEFDRKYRPMRVNHDNAPDGTG